ncbi:MAG: HAD family hydrolase, partial [Thermoplasmata archaeon]|nr:HAD family hydrolase [Thermoplasmata archaeon]
VPVGRRAYMGLVPLRACRHGVVRTTERRPPLRSEAVVRVTIRAVLFDLDGTLVDLRDYLGWSEEAEQLGFGVEPELMAHYYVEKLTEFDRSPPPPPERGVFWRSVLAAARGIPPTDLQVAKFVDRVRRRPRRVHLFSDTRRCLEALRRRGHRLAVVSNTERPEAGVRETLDEAGIGAYFSAVLSSYSEGVKKPAREMFERAAARLGVRPAEACHVGDLANTDARGARAAGLLGVWLHRGGTGFGDDPPEINSLTELPRWLELRSPG